MPGVERLEHRVVLHQPHDPISAVVMSPFFATDGEMFVIDEGRQILKSTDSGRTFFVPRDPIVAKPVAAIAFSPAYQSDQIVFAGVEGEGTYRSTDRGESWSVAANGLADLSVTAIAFSPNFANNQIVFAGTEGGRLYRSTNGGELWQQVHASLGNRVTDIELSTTGTVLVSHDGGGVFRSTNGGASFFASSFGLGNFRVTSLEISATFATDQRALAGTDGGGVFLTINGGASWQAFSTGLAGLNIVDVEMTAEGLAAAVARTEGVFVRGVTATRWTRVTNGIAEFDQAAGSHYFDLAPSPSFAADGKAFVATFGGLYETHQPSPVWVEANVTPYRYNREVQVSPNFANDQTLFAATYGGGLMKSVDGGATWSVHSWGMENVYIDNIAVSPNYATDQTLFSGNFLGVFKSTDGGETWSLSKFRPELSVEIYARDVEVSPNFANDQLVLGSASTTGSPDRNGIYRSIDGGETWTRSVTGLPANPQVDQLEFSPNFAVDNTIFAGVRNAGVYKSVDGGLTWTAANTGIEGDSVGRLRVSPTFVIDQTLFVVSQARLMRSTDGGDSWAEMATGLPAVTAVTISPQYATDQTVLIGAGPYGVFRSTDGGQTWNAGSVGLDRASINDIVVSPDFAGDGTVIVGTSRGAYRSSDAGDTFTFIQTHNRYEDEQDLMYFSDEWRTLLRPDVSGPRIHFANQVGATLEFEFFGSEVLWLGSNGPNHGRARVSIDGQVVANVDLYDPVLSAGVTVFQSPVQPGWHTLVIEVLGTSNPTATGSFVTVDAIDVFEGVASSSTSVAFIEPSQEMVVENSSLTIEEPHSHDYPHEHDPEPDSSGHWPAHDEGHHNRRWWDHSALPWIDSHVPWRPDRAHALVHHLWDAIVDGDGEFLSRIIRRLLGRR